MIRWEKEEEILACTTGCRVVPVTEMEPVKENYFWKGGELRGEEAYI